MSRNDCKWLRFGVVASLGNSFVVWRLVWSTTLGACALSTMLERRGGGGKRKGPQLPSPHMSSGGTDLEIVVDIWTVKQAHKDLVDR